MVRTLLSLGLALLVAQPTAAAATLVRQAGDILLLRQRYETSSASSDGSRSSSSGNETQIERVIEASETRLLTELDLPDNTSADDRARVWQLPARFVRLVDGTVQLQNADELEARLDVWLQRGGMTRAACGQWIFTWSAIKIECDPQTVVEQIDALSPFDLNPQSGEMYQHPMALAAAPLVASDDGGLAVELDLDVAKVRQQRAETAVVTGQIVDEPVTLQAALEEQARIELSGAIRVSINFDPSTGIWRRVTRTSLRSRTIDGVTEDSTSTVTLEISAIRRTTS